VTLVSNGYIGIWDNIKKGYNLEHRLVLENTLGRKLLKREIVHHADGNPTNNRLSNLILLSPETHVRIHCLGKPNIKNRKFKIFHKLPTPTNIGEVVSLFPKYKTYRTIKCEICEKLFWTRKDSKTRCCKITCAMKLAWKNKDQNGFNHRRKRCPKV